MGTLHHGKVIATAFAATTSQAGYPATNVGGESLARPWRATGLGATDVTITFPAATTVKTWHLHDVNFGSAQILKSADGIAFVTIVGSPLVTFMGKESRRRGAILVNDANVKAMRVSIAAGAATDGLGYWRIGSAPPFSNSFTFGAPHQFGYRARFVYPQVRNGLVNGPDAVAYTGPGYHMIQLPFKPYDTDDIEPIVRLARSGTVLLDLAMTNFPWQIWPARLDEREMDEAFEAAKLSELTLNFREVV